MDQPTVLIVSDQADFSTTVSSRWQAERTVPAFTLMGSDLCRKLDPETYTLALVGEIRPANFAGALKELEVAGRPVLLVAGEQEKQLLREAQQRFPVLRKQEGWLDMLVLLGTEVLRRCEAEEHARALEKSNSTLERQATLGRYMLEMLHNLNNALTSVLGNSELLLLEPGSLSAAARSQLETVRNMALRMHEVLQRFASLEKELKVVERQSETEKQSKRCSAAGL
ncbi:MAG: hypothetical protein JST79_20120 [Acidobacteria bacterium]|nr:hypothetical protein [Acidobacteriota bacterium]